MLNFIAIDSSISRHESHRAPCRQPQSTSIKNIRSTLQSVQSTLICATGNSSLSLESRVSMPCNVYCIEGKIINLCHNRLGKNDLRRQLFNIEADSTADVGQECDQNVFCLVLILIKSQQGKLSKINESFPVRCSVVADVGSSRNFSYFHVRRKSFILFF